MSTQTFSPEVPHPVLQPEFDNQTPSPAKRPGLRILQPEVTYTGAPIKPLQKGLPKQTESLCPECTKVIRADIFADASKVVMEKTCAEHGHFRDIIFSDVELYLKMEEWNFGDNLGLSNPQVEGGKTCPDDCGLCGMHTSHTALANVDLTNRCNLTCPVCFANANVAGYLYEPSVEQIRGMLETLRNERPVDGRVVQFSGGEPTLHPQFFEILSMAREMGFTHIQAATNGIELANLEFAQKAKEAGLATLYRLQFDGVTDDIYLRTRGRSLLETKMKVIENCRTTGMKIVFVPTIVKGLNDDQIGDIVVAWRSIMWIPCRASAFSRLPSPAASPSTNCWPSALLWLILRAASASKPASPTRGRIGSPWPASRRSRNLRRRCRWNRSADHLVAPALFL